MSEMSPLLLNVLACSASAANRAGGIIRDVMNKGELGIISKGINDLQTEADRSAQDCIVASLLKAFPDITIIGEEEQDVQAIPDDWIVTTPLPDILNAKKVGTIPSVGIKDIVVWVDPLDGTSEYTQGLLHHVTVLIGIAVNGEAVGGVIHQPFFKENNSLGRTIWGLQGLGIGGFVPSTPPPSKFIITTTRSHSNETVESTLQSLKPDDVLRVGGSGYKVLILLEGNAHAYVFASPGTKKWDTCAPEAILKCVGGLLTDIYGQPYSYDKHVKFSNSKGVLATVSLEYHEKCKLAIKHHKVTL